jgi:hypothetical protein
MSTWASEDDLALVPRKVPETGTASSKVTEAATGNHVKPLANKWLDSVQSSVPKDGCGSFYGYRKPFDRPAASATTAIGLLCRIYLGARADDPGLATGAAALVTAGPSEGAMYYNYHTTLALYQICRPQS